MKGGLNAAAGRGEAAWGNLTTFLDTDRHRLTRNLTLFGPGCSRPCSHCQPCVGPNTMVEEGTNPILEGGPAIAANVQDMLLQDFIVDTGGAPGASSSITLISVFPAVPRRWKNTVFYRLRVLGAMYFRLGLDFLLSLTWNC